MQTGVFTVRVLYVATQVHGWVKPAMHAFRSGRALLPPSIPDWVAGSRCAARSLACFFEPLAPRDCDEIEIEREVGSDEGSYEKKPPVLPELEGPFAQRPDLVLGSLGGEDSIAGKRRDVVTVRFGLEGADGPPPKASSVVAQESLTTIAHFRTTLSYCTRLTHV